MKQTSQKLLKDLWALKNDLDKFKRKMDTLLQDPNFDVNAQVFNGGDGDTLLINAIWCQRRDLVKYLLTLPKIDIHVQNKKNQSAFYWSDPEKYRKKRTNSQVQILQEISSDLEKHGKKLERLDTQKSELIKQLGMCKDGDLEVFKQTINTLLNEHEFEINAGLYNGSKNNDTILIHQIYRGNSKIVQHLLSFKGIDVFAKNARGQDAWYWANYSNYKKTGRFRERIKHTVGIHRIKIFIKKKTHQDHLEEIEATLRDCSESLFRRHANEIFNLALKNQATEVLKKYAMQFIVSLRAHPTIASQFIGDSGDAAEVRKQLVQYYVSTNKYEALMVLFGGDATNALYHALCENRLNKLFIFQLINHGAEISVVHERMTQSDRSDISQEIRDAVVQVKIAHDMLDYNQPNQLQSLKTLLDADRAAANALVNEHGETFLIIVAKAGRDKFINLILQYLPNVLVKDNAGKMALDYARENAYPDIEYCLKRVTLEQAIQAHDISFIQSLIDQYPDLLNATVNANRETGIILLAKEFSKIKNETVMLDLAKVIEQWISKGADIFYQDGTGKSADFYINQNQIFLDKQSQCLFHFKSQNTHIKRFREYIQSGDSESFKRLFDDCARIDPEMLHALLNYRVGQLGNNLLILAIANHQIEMAKYLVKNYLADVTMMNHQGQDALQHAIDINKKSPSEEVAMLIDELACLQLTTLIERNDPNGLRDFLDRFSPEKLAQLLNKEIGRGFTALTLSLLQINADNKALVELLIQRGANVTTKDGHDLPPLCYAMNKGQVEYVRLLHEKGAVLIAEEFRAYLSPYDSSSDELKIPKSIFEIVGQFAFQLYYLDKSSEAENEKHQKPLLEYFKLLNTESQVFLLKLLDAERINGNEAFVEHFDSYYRLVLNKLIQTENQDLLNAIIDLYGVSRCTILMDVAFDCDNIEIQFSIQSKILEYAINADDKTTVQTLAIANPALIEAFQLNTVIIDEFDEMFQSALNHLIEQENKTLMLKLIHQHGEQKYKLLIPISEHCSNKEIKTEIQKAILYYAFKNNDKESLRTMAELNIKLIAEYRYPATKNSIFEMVANAGMMNLLKYFISTMDNNGFNSKFYKQLLIKNKFQQNVSSMLKKHLFLKYFSEKNSDAIHDFSDQNPEFLNQALTESNENALALAVKYNLPKCIAQLHSRGAKIFSPVKDKRNILAYAVDVCTDANMLEILFKGALDEYKDHPNEQIMRDITLFCRELVDRGIFTNDTLSTVWRQSTSKNMSKVAQCLFEIKKALGLIDLSDNTILNQVLKKEGDAWTSLGKALYCEMLEGLADKPGIEEDFTNFIETHRDLLGVTVSEKENMTPLLLMIDKMHHASEADAIQALDNKIGILTKISINLKNAKVIEEQTDFTKEEIQAILHPDFLDKMKSSDNKNLLLAWSINSAVKREEVDFIRTFFERNLENSLEKYGGINMLLFNGVMYKNVNSIQCLVEYGANIEYKVNSEKVSTIQYALRQKESAVLQALCSGSVSALEREFDKNVEAMQPQVIIQKQAQIKETASAKQSVLGFLNDLIPKYLEDHDYRDAAWWMRRERCVIQYDDEARQIYLPPIIARIIDAISNEMKFGKIFDWVKCHHQLLAIKGNKNTWYETIYKDYNTQDFEKNDFTVNLTNNVVVKFNRQDKSFALGAFSTDGVDDSKVDVSINDCVAELNQAAVKLKKVFHSKLDRLRLDFEGSNISFETDEGVIALRNKIDDLKYSVSPIEISPFPVPSAPSLSMKDISLNSDHQSYYPQLKSRSKLSTPVIHASGYATTPPLSPTVSSDDASVESDSVNTAERVIKTLRQYFDKSDRHIEKDKLVRQAEILIRDSLGGEGEYYDRLKSIQGILNQMSGENRKYSGRADRFFSLFSSAYIGGSLSKKIAISQNIILQEMKKVFPLVGVNKPMETSNSYGYV